MTPYAWDQKIILLWGQETRDWVEKVINKEQRLGLWGCFGNLRNLLKFDMGIVGTINYEIQKILSLTIELIALKIFSCNST